VGNTVASLSGSLLPELEAAVIRRVATTLYFRLFEPQITEPQVVIAFIGPKASVAGSTSPRSNPAANCRACCGYCWAWDRERMRV